jgi:tRNA pseudouridine38-40 synthase
VDVSAMAEALALLPIGVSRDWAAFSGAVLAGYSTVRTLLDARVERCGPHTVQVTLEADAFLPHQVRLVVGTLQRVGVGRLSPVEFAAVLDGPAASAASAAPPQGLTLVAVRYPPGTIEWGN